MENNQPPRIRRVIMDSLPSFLHRVAVVLEREGQIIILEET
jgi:hypothetical protein